MLFLNGNDDEEQQWANYKLNETPSKGYDVGNIDQRL
jgi:hypothetical protein